MRRHSEAGAALVIALMLTALLTFIGGALLYLVDLETAISANHHAAEDLREAAESGIECAIAELAALPDWTDVPNDTVNPVLRCLDAGLPARTPDGTPLNLAQLTASVQAWSDRRHGPLADNPDSPSWSLLAGGPVGARAGRGHPYILVWTADDVDDGDGAPRLDANGVVMLRAQAFGRRGARAGVDAMVRRVPGAGPQSSPVRVLSWRPSR